MDRYRENTLEMQDANNGCQGTPYLHIPKEATTFFAKSLSRTSERVDYLEEIVAQVQNTIDNDQTSICLKLKQLARNQSSQVL
jgi:hypothetical protein